jgi:hypothetical protein
MASRIQQVAVNVTAIGSATPWIKHDIYQTPFNLTLTALWDSVLGATMGVQYISDDQSQTSERPVTVTQAGTTTATVTDYGPSTINGGPANASWGGPFGHGLQTGDQVWLEGTQAGIDSGLQSYTVTVTSQTQYTITVPLSQTINVSARVTSGRIFTHATLTGITARATGNYAFPVWASRAICTAFSSAGRFYLLATQGK